MEVSVVVPRDMIFAADFVYSPLLCLVVVRGRELGGERGGYIGISAEGPENEEGWSVIETVGGSGGGSMSPSTKL